MRHPRQEMPEVSVVVPMYRESAHLGVVLDAIGEQAGAACESFEIIAVDDGSPDDTWERLAAEARRRPYLRAVRLSRNFGKEHALSAGLEASRGEAVVRCTRWKGSRIQGEKGSRFSGPRHTDTVVHVGDRGMPAGAVGGATDRRAAAEAAKRPAAQHTRLAIVAIPT